MSQRFNFILVIFMCVNLSGFSQKQNTYSSGMNLSALEDSISTQLIESENLIDSLPELSAQISNLARKHAAAMNMEEKEALASYLLGRAKINLNEYYEAREYLSYALHHYKTTNNLKLTPFILYYLSIPENNTGRPDKAIAHLKEALVLFEELGLNIYQAGSLQKLGQISHTEKNYIEAEKYYKLALDEFNTLKNLKEIACIHRSLGNLHDDMGYDSLALCNFSKSIEISKELHDLNCIGSTYDNIGKYYLKRNNATKAYKNFQKSLTYFTKSGFKAGQMWTLNNIGKSKTLEEEIIAAEAFYLKSLEIAKELNHPEGKITNYADLARISEQSGNIASSLEFYKQGSLLKDSLNTARANQKIARLEVLYQTESNEKKAVKIGAESKRFKMMLWGASGFAALLFLASFVILWAYNQKRNAEKKLTEHKENLKKLVETRTIELQKQISERKIAQESDKLKSAFLANMSHELRTPMNAIIAFSNFLREPNLDDEKRNEYLDHITTAGDSLLRIIDDIIDIAKIESKQLKLFIQPTNINRLLLELFKVFGRLKDKSDKSHINFKLNIEQEFNYIINTDSQRLKQILTNLIENAFKYTDKGKIEMGCEMKKQKVIFYVSDTGIGIPADKQRLIFNRFFQLHGLKDRRTGGTGLGLAICKNLVNFLGGKIWVESEKNKGSKFSFSIPVESIKKQPNPGYKNIEKKNKPLNPKYNWNNITILIAEDEDLNYKVLDTCLTRTKAHIIRAKDGASAVEICKNQKVDIVLMDIQMPIMDGYEATQEIKRMNIRTPVIAQTSFAMVGEKERCLQAGCDDFITKPLNIDSLLSKIEHYLK